jgi:hypothetical protein
MSVILIRLQQTLQGLRGAGIVIASIVPLLGRVETAEAG